jgi:hypothetical protein
MIVMSGAVVTGIAHRIAVKVFLSGIVLVGAIVQAVRDTITIKVRSAAGVGYFITEQGRTGIAGAVTGISIFITILDTRAKQPIIRTGDTSRLATNERITDFSPVAEPPIIAVCIVRKRVTVVPSLITSIDGAFYSVTAVRRWAGLASSRTIAGLITVAKQPIGAGTTWRFKGTCSTAAVTI